MKFTGSLVLCFVCIFGIQSAYAAAPLKLYDGTSTVIIGVEGAGHLITTPNSGSWTIPELDLNTIHSSSIGGTLDRWFSELGFWPLSVLNSSFIKTNGSTTNYTVNVKTYFNNSNAVSGDVTSIGTASTPVTPSSVSLTGTQNTSLNVNATLAPEPVSSALFIAGVAALGFRRFMKKRKQIA